MPQPLGVHVSIAGGIEQAFARGEAIGCTAIQIFTKNASQWRAKPITAQSAAAFRACRQTSPIGPVAAHDSYLINLAAPIRPSGSRPRRPSPTSWSAVPCSASRPW